MTDTKTTAVFPLTREPALPEAASIAAAELPVIAVLVGLALTMQVAINIMIPALPALGAELGATPLGGKLTLTAFIVGYGCSPLFIGPLADRFGRRPVLICGLSLYALASVACTVAPSIETLVMARFLQGFGGASGIVNARAIARDLWSGAKFSRVNAYLSAGQGIGPLLAPLVGALLQEHLGWRSVFGFTALFGAGLLLAYAALLAESNAQRLQTLAFAALRRGYREVLGSRRFLQPALTSAFSFASWYAFFAGAPHLFIDLGGLSPSGFGAIVSIMVTGFVVTTIVAGRKAATWGEERLVAAGRALAVAGIAATALVVLFDPGNVYAIVPPMIVYAAGSGFLLPMLNAAALRPFPHLAGTAAAASMALFNSASALGTVAAGLVESVSPEAFVVVMVLAQCLSVAAHLAFSPKAAGA